MRRNGASRAHDGRAAQGRRQDRGQGRGRFTYAVRAAAAAIFALALAVTLAACGGPGNEGRTSADGETGARGRDHAGRSDPRRIPGVGDAMHARIPEKSRQVVAVYGRGEDSAAATVRLFTRKGERWVRDRSWPGHNGRKGWTPDHREGDKRSPVGVFTLTDAGGLRPAPDAKLPYTTSDGFTPPSHWPRKTRHDFDHVIAVDYNRVEGTSPLDPRRPEGQSKGGSIWLHLDHGSGTSGCVSISRSGMRYLLRTLEPKRHPVVVMGDREALAR